MDLINLDFLGLDIAFALLIVSTLVATWRMLKGPTEADRAIAGDLLMFGVAGLIAIFGVRLGGQFTFDIVLVASVIGFLSAISLGRALTRGQR
ncbi:MULTISPECIES: monovalent cation/H+ antiporter complex subunit F [Auritidibacter]|uniref:Monovalent cation/H+ antiporter complex subunit F n=1 Tax=Auritidibacter ignavus TaxID=678932 RepID=A0AAJ6AHR0_9MICC|nr:MULTISPECIES: monovalent cation/H+ antiporter complex subunit F [Auritidibacter]PXA82408.1 pesticidal protein Cry26Aa [Auritidibacter sp. NML120779]AXR73472.1 pesticidal protein Cry26Aa [Auritidibacter sp. NML130574]NIH70719.1 multicomponent Na+:H+ antiporter subunit F [Auritidibacter ignavus]PXA77737.1 pesticidal protein Cry26Aa [Auritidibacter sp. NML100628]PXA80372.1 pesticidal protein Cry26Aa [Auritidibacter sp. NML120636]